MKIGIKLLSVAATLLLAGAIASVPKGAAAADGDIDTFAHVGFTCSLTPMQLVGGSGTYSICGSVGFCTSSDTTPPEAFTCTRQESGSYTSIVCGTGSWSGSATTTEGDGGSDTVPTNTTFVSGLGVQTGGDTALVLLVPTGIGTAPSCATAFDVVTIGVGS
jgi:hypothetical protein